MIPLAFLTIEIAISIQGVTAENTFFFNNNPQKKYKSLWWWLSCLTLAIVGSLFLATFLAAHGLDSIKNPAFLLLMIGMTIIALVSHALILFGGRTATDAKEFLIGKFKYHQLHERVKREKYKLAQLAKSLVNAYSS